MVTNSCIVDAYWRFPVCALGIGWLCDMYTVIVVYMHPTSMWLSLYMCGSLTCMWLSLSFCCPYDYCCVCAVGACDGRNGLCLCIAVWLYRLLLHMWLEWIIVVCDYNALMPCVCTGMTYGRVCDWNIAAYVTGISPRMWLEYRSVCDWNIAA